MTDEQLRTAIKSKVDKMGGMVLRMIARKVGVIRNEYTQSEGAGKPWTDQRP